MPSSPRERATPAPGRARSSRCLSACTTIHATFPPAHLLTHPHSYNTLAGSGLRPGPSCTQRQLIKAGASRRRATGLDSWPRTCPSSRRERVSGPRSTAAPSFNSILLSQARFSPCLNSLASSSQVPSLPPPHTGSGLHTRLFVWPQSRAGKSRRHAPPSELNARARRHIWPLQNY